MSTLGDIGADRATGPEESDLRANSEGIRDDGSGGGNKDIVAEVAPYDSSFLNFSTSSTGAGFTPLRMPT